MDNIIPLFPGKSDKAASSNAAKDSWRSILPVPEDAPALDVVWTIEGVTRPPDFVWAYRDVAFALMGYACRWNLSCGTKKQFSFAHFGVDESGQAKWMLKHFETPRPLYGLFEIAERQDAPIVVVEGEKTKDAAMHIFPDSVVVTSPGGAGSAKQADWAVLAGRQRALIIPDADKPGIGYADDVARILHAIGVPEIEIADGERLSQLLPDGSERPVIVGWDLADAYKDEWPLDAIRDAVLATAKPYNAVPAKPVTSLFVMKPEGLFVTVTKGRGENSYTAEERVCGPFVVTGRARNPNGEGWARRIQFLDSDGREHTESVTDAELHGDIRALTARIASYGLNIERSAGKYLADYLNMVDPKERITDVVRTGWLEIDGTTVFVFPGFTVGMLAGETVQLKATGKSPYEQHGSLDDWRAGVGRLTATHMRPILAVATAFAGPLLYIVGENGGGINLYGPSSRGKSTCAEAAASVWGKGASPGYMQSWRATANALEGAAAIANDTLLVLDELGVVEARDAAAAIYQLSGGTGKGRLSKDGKLKQSDTWRVLVVSTGEIPMSVKISEDRNQKARAGQQVRMLDIPADMGLGFGAFNSNGDFDDAGALANAIKKAARTNFGTAGPAFVQHLVDLGIAEIRQIVVVMIDEFVKSLVDPSSDAQIGRVARRLGLIAAAGELAIEFGIVPWTPGDARLAAARALRDWIDSQGGTNSAEARAAINQVRQFIETYGTSAFETLHSKDRIIPNRAGWTRGQGREQEWLIGATTWKSKICIGLDGIHVAKTLFEHGMLRRSPDGYTINVPIDGNSKRFYILTAKILGDADEG